MGKDRLDKAKKKLRRDKVVKKAGKDAPGEDARDVVRERTRSGDPLWFPWWKR